VDVKSFLGGSLFIYFNILIFPGVNIRKPTKCNRLLQATGFPIDAELDVVYKNVARKKKDIYLFLGPANT